jgi:hypothetical protein
MSKEAMNRAIDVLKDSQDYKMGRAMTVEAVEELEEAVLNLDRKVVSLQCVNCQVTIETLNNKVMSLLANQEQRSDSEQLGEPDYKTLAIQLQQQRTWVGLSYEEAKEIYSCIHGYDAPKRISEAIEAKLKAKNGFHSTEKNT